MLLCCLFCLTLGVNQTLLAQQVEWMSLEEAVEKSKKAPRKIFVDIVTEFCHYCKKMDKETFTNKYIAKYLNENFYPVKLDGQHTNDIAFKNKNYSFVRRSGQNSYHELAAKLMNGRLSYPTIVFLDEKQEVIQSIPGYRGALEFELFITYFGENQHKSIPWSTYKRNLTPTKKAPQINVKNE